MSSVFKIYSPEDCDFYYDGEFQGHIEGDSDRAFRFEVERRGAYRLKFVDSKYKSELLVKVFIDTNEEQEVELDFTEVNEPVIKRITTAIEHNYGREERLPDEIISAISKNGIVIIPKGVRKIGALAFSKCYNLTSVTIPDSVTEIGDYAFYNCNSLSSITIPHGITVIGKKAFSGCHSLTSITIPDSVTMIAWATFSGCHNLTSITIPDSVTTIGVSAFSSCHSLKSVIIPDRVTTVGEFAFWKCSSLTAFYGKYASRDGRCLIKDNILLGFAPYDITKYTIPDNVNAIGEGVFYNCHSLKSIIIPACVNTIGEEKFYFCRCLTSVYCKATTPPKLEGGIFYYNASVLKIYIPKSDGSIVLEAYKSAEGWKDYADIIEEYDFNNE